MAGGVEISREILSQYSISKAIRTAIAHPAPTTVPASRGASVGLSTCKYESNYAPAKVVSDALSLGSIPTELRMHYSQAPDALLDSYQTERRPHVREVIAVTKDFGLIIGELNAEAARLRDERLVGELQSGKAEVIRQRFIPGLVDGLLHRGADGAPGAAAGALFPQPMLLTGDGLPPARMDDVLCGDGINRFVLLLQDVALMQALQPATLPVALLALLRRLDVQVLLLSPATLEQALPEVRHVSETASLIADWLQSHGARAVLVRPDRYAYGVASDAAGLHALLASLDAQLR